MVDEVPGGAVHRLELHGQSPQTAVAGQPESRVLLEHLAVQVHTDVGSHVLGADLQDLAGAGRSRVRVFAVASGPCLSAPKGRSNPREARLPSSQYWWTRQPRHLPLGAYTLAGETPVNTEFCAECSEEALERRVWEYMGLQVVVEGLWEEVTFKLLSLKEHSSSKAKAVKEADQ